MNEPAQPTLHPVDERLPAPRLFALGLQHVLVMYAGAIAVPLIIGGALKLPKDQIALLTRRRRERANNHGRQGRGLRTLTPDTVSPMTSR